MWLTFKTKKFHQYWVFQGFVTGFLRSDQHYGQIVALYLLVWGESGLLLRETYKDSWCWGGFLGLLILSFSFHIPVSLGSFHHLYMTHVLPCGQCPEATCALCQRCFTSSRGSCIIPPSLVLLGSQHHSVDVKAAVVFEKFVEVRTWSGVWRGCMRIFCSTQTSTCHSEVRAGRSNAFLVQVVRPIYKVWMGRQEQTAW